MKRKGWEKRKRKGACVYEAWCSVPTNFNRCGTKNAQKPTHVCSRTSGSAVSFAVIVAPFLTTLDGFVDADWDGVRWWVVDGGCSVSLLLCPGRQSLGVRQLIELVVATSPLAVLVRRQSKHVATHLYTRIHQPFTAFYSRFNETAKRLAKDKQEAFEKCWAHSLLRAAVTLPVTRCR